MNPSEFKDQIFNLWKRMSFSKKVSLIILILVVVTGIILIYFRAHKVEYTTLYSGLEADEAGKIVEKLKSGKIPYKIIEGGKVISVPFDKVDETRLQFAREGLPRSGVGYEIFDKKSWGMTDFVEKVNYKRALEGELTRSIRELKEIEFARVHLVLPEEKLFKEDKKEPSASVLLKLKPGYKLSSFQVQGIASLLAHSIEGLSDSNISIIDYSGNPLFSREIESSLKEITSLQPELKKESLVCVEDKNSFSRVPSKAGEGNKAESFPMNLVFKYYWTLALILIPFLLSKGIRWRKLRKSAIPPLSVQKTQDELTSKAIGRTDSQRYLELLQDETPQIIAIILSQLPQSDAGDILNRFPAEKQVEVTSILNRIEEISPEVKKRVWRAFQALSKSDSKDDSSYVLEDQLK